MKTSENLGFPDVFRLYKKDKWHEMSKYLQNRLDIFLESLKLCNFGNFLNIIVWQCLYVFIIEFFKKIVGSV